ncbi:unnamed protein product [Protopolystoma xenopodis]|uniref:Uncharacterized protein n=1 Tax=Protopolystoma xenopodis TaxID=117903 RepID=A0A3S5CV71_9PLAT|nr:unnamed protein product [Protopolystoma xenopodis]
MVRMAQLRLIGLPEAPFISTVPPESKNDGDVCFAITNHPHYESAQLRRRTLLAYSMYSRQTVADVWKIYRHQLKVSTLPCRF